MLRLICKNNSTFVQNRTDVFAFLLSFENPTSHSLVRFISNNAIDDNDNKSFTISYLMNTCGLSQDKATSGSKKVQLKASINPDSVVTLFRNHGIPNTYISKIIEKEPKLLLYDADKCIKPKLEFFQSLGISGSDLAKFLSLGPRLLMRSLENQLIPNIAILKSILGTQSDTKFTCIIKRSQWFLCDNPQRALAPNIAILRAQGVPDKSISCLMAHPSICMPPTSKFKEIVEQVKKLKIDSSTFAFVKAIELWASTSESTRQAKVAVFRKWGLSNDDIQEVLRKRPECFMLSVKNLTQKMEFFIDKLGNDTSLIVKAPFILNFSMEKRLIPRYSVINILMSSGLLEKDLNILAVMKLPEKNFRENFITKFQSRAPEILDAIKGKLSGNSTFT